MQRRSIHLREKQCILEHAYYHLLSPKALEKSCMIANLPACIVATAGVDTNRNCLRSFF